MRQKTERERSKCDLHSPLGAKQGVVLGLYGSLTAHTMVPEDSRRRGCETRHNMNCGPRMGASGKFALSAAPFGVAPNLVVILEINNFEHNFCSRSLNVK